MIIIEKALGKDNIDEVVTLSREYRDREGGQSRARMYRILLIQDSKHYPRDQIPSK